MTRITMLKMWFALAMALLAAPQVFAQSRLQTSQVLVCRDGRVTSARVGEHACDRNGGIDRNATRAARRNGVNGPTDGNRSVYGGIDGNRRHRSVYGTVNGRDNGRVERDDRDDHDDDDRGMNRDDDDERGVNGNGNGRGHAYGHYKAKHHKHGDDDDRN